MIESTSLNPENGNLNTEQGIYVTNPYGEPFLERFASDASIKSGLPIEYLPDSFKVELIPVGSVPLVMLFVNKCLNLAADRCLDVTGFVHSLYRNALNGIRTPLVISTFAAIALAFSSFDTTPVDAQDLSAQNDMEIVYDESADNIDELDVMAAEAPQIASITKTMAIATCKFPDIQSIPLSKGNRGVEMNFTTWSQLIGDPSKFGTLENYLGSFGVRLSTASVSREWREFPLNSQSYIDEKWGGLKYFDVIYECFALHGDNPDNYDLPVVHINGEIPGGAFGITLFDSYTIIGNSPNNPFGIFFTLGHETLHMLGSKHLEMDKLTTRYGTTVFDQDQEYFPPLDIMAYPGECNIDQSPFGCFPLKPDLGNLSLMGLAEGNFIRLYGINGSTEVKFGPLYQSDLRPTPVNLPRGVIIQLPSVDQYGKQNKRTYFLSYLLPGQGYQESLRQFDRGNLGQYGDVPPLDLMKPWTSIALYDETCILSNYCGIQYLGNPRGDSSIPPWNFIDAYGQQDVIFDRRTGYRFKILPAQNSSEMRVMITRMPYSVFLPAILGRH